MSKTSHAKAAGDKLVGVQLSPHAKELWGVRAPFLPELERIETDKDGVARVPVEVAAQLCGIVCPIDVQVTEGEGDDAVTHTTPTQVRLFEPKTSTDADAIEEYQKPAEVASGPVAPAQVDAQGEVEATSAE